MTPIDTTHWRELNDGVIAAVVAWVRALLTEQVPPSEPPTATRARWLARRHPPAAPAQPTARTEDAAADLAAAEERMTAAGGSQL